MNKSVHEQISPDFRISQKVKHVGHADLAAGGQARAGANGAYVDGVEILE